MSSSSSCLLVPLPLYLPLRRCFCHDLQEEEEAAAWRAAATGTREQVVVVRAGDDGLRGGQQQRAWLLPLCADAPPQVRRALLPDLPLRPHPRLRWRVGITFDAIVRGMLVGTLSDDKLRRMQSDVLAMTRAMLAFPLRMPGTRFHSGLQARSRIMDVLRQEIASRRRDIKTDDYCNDFLHSLLRNSSLSDDQILDNILTLIIAGQVTTATAITWMLKYLADNTDLQETLRSVQLELAPKHHDSPLTLQQLNGMDFAYKVVKESLWMATIVSWFPRVALQDCQVAVFHIKKGWIVNVDARSLHYDPKIYDNPTMFDPSRFDEEKKANSFLAFGAGGRTCLGMNLAKMMMLIFLHRFVTTFRWEMADDDPSLEKWAMFPRLKNGCPLHLTPI